MFYFGKLMDGFVSVADGAFGKVDLFDIEGSRMRGNAYSPLWKVDIDWFIKWEWRIRL